MAATNAYVTITRIPSGGDVGEGVIPLSNSSADSAVFGLQGGKYAIDVIASTFGTVTLQRLGPDGSTFITAATAFSANGSATADLPPGRYKVALG